MARKNGCPMNVRDWVIEIMSRASTTSNPTWIRIKGIDSITLTRGGNTEDGSASDSLYEEPYISKRNGSLAIEGKPVYDAVTGAQDAGQAELDHYATQGGCDGDARLRLVDPYGHAELIDVVVTNTERGTDDTSQTVSWDTEIVGESEVEAYVQVTSVKVKVGSSGTAATTANATLTVGTSQTVTVSFEPTAASNQKYSVASADTTKVQVKNVDGLTFDLVPVAPTAQSSSVSVVVRSMNNNKTATITCTVNAAT